ncbi:MFS transporter [Streptosporangium sp. NPDC006013]|uniref:MFS transporter n=1 Tax=Streptosporangium sp. NPDC006013 TaxID=3155596 RepID=UPI0033B572AB
MSGEPSRPDSTDAPRTASSGTVTRFRDLGGQSWWPLGILFALNAVDELDRAATGVLLPMMRDDFGLSISTVTAVISLGGTVATVFAIVGGYFADRIPRVRMVVISYTLLAMSTFLTGMATTLLLFAAGRVGSSLGKAVGEPIHKSLLSDYYTPETRGRVFALHGSASAIGTLIAPLLAGVIAQAFGWRVPFALFAIPTVVFVVIAAIKLREPVRGAHERRAAGGDETAAQQEELAPTIAEAWRELHRIRTVRRLLASLPLLAVAVLGQGLLLSQFYDQRYQLKVLDLGVLVTLTSISSIIGFLIFSRIADRGIAATSAGLYRLMAIGTTVAALCLAAVPLAPNLPSSMLALVLNALFSAPLAVGTGIVLSLVVPPRMRSTGFSVSAIYFLPGFVLVSIVGVVTEKYGFTVGFMSITACMLLGMLVFWRGTRTIDADVARVRAESLAGAESLLNR